MSPWPLLASLVLAAHTPPLIPKDTLPANLALDAIPLGLDPRTVPENNPLTESRVQLGRKLFFDPILSGDRTVACASCHQPDHGFTAGAAHARGIGGKGTKRRPPTLLNRAYGAAFFWDGRETSLEAQALRPIEDPTEMGAKLADVVKILKADKEYNEQFESAFTDGVTAANIGKALAGFERVLLRGDSVIDRFRRKGDREALTAEERHGLWRYESKARCWKCHSGANFTDEKFHNTGVSWALVVADPGRFAITKNKDDHGKFKTPTLRGVSKAAPYMHDGSVKTLEDVVEFYNRGGDKNPHIDDALKPLDLTKEEKQDLVAFLKAL